MQLYGLQKIEHTWEFQRKYKTPGPSNPQVHSAKYQQDMYLDIYLKGCWSYSGHNVSITKYYQGR